MSYIELSKQLRCDSECTKFSQEADGVVIFTIRVADTENSKEYVVAFDGTQYIGEGGSSHEASPFVVAMTQFRKDFPLS